MSGFLFWKVYAPSWHAVWLLEVAGNKIHIYAMKKITFIVNVFICGLFNDAVSTSTTVSSPISELWVLKHFSFSCFLIQSVIMSWMIFYKDYYAIIQMGLSWTISLVMEFSGSTPLTPNPANGHDPEPAASISPILASCIPKIHLNIILHCLQSYKWLFSNKFPYRNYVCILLCPFLLDFTAITISGNLYKLLRCDYQIQ